MHPPLNHMHQSTRLFQPLDMGVFELGDRVGGRIKSVQIPHHISKFIEMGAKTFTENDRCLIGAMTEVEPKPSLKTERCLGWQRIYSDVRQR